MNKGIIEIAIGEETVEIDTEKEAAIHDVSSDMATVSARIAWFGELLAAAEEELVIVDAAYRNWRAKEYTAGLKKDPKIAEWKLKANVEASDAFTNWKEAIGKATYNVTALKNLIKALEEKSPNLRSKGARQRAELDATDMSTPSRETAERNKERLRGSGGGKDGEDAKPKKQPRR